jgi:hypothetical protein
VNVVAVYKKVVSSQIVLLVEKFLADLTSFSWTLSVLETTAITIHGRRFKCKGRAGWVGGWGWERGAPKGAQYVLFPKTVPSKSHMSQLDSNSRYGVRKYSRVTSTLDLRYLTLLCDNLNNRMFLQNFFPKIGPKPT